MKIEVGSRLRARRKAEGLTQKKLAEMAGVGRSDVSRLERAKLNPSLEKLEKLAGALDTSLGELFRGL